MPLYIMSALLRFFDIIFLFKNITITISIFLLLFCTLTRSCIMCILYVIGLCRIASRVTRGISVKDTCHYRHRGATLSLMSRVIQHVIP